jgi:formylglycine-generating enzyme required for sulfatase activity
MPVVLRLATYLAALLIGAPAAFAAAVAAPEARLELLVGSIFRECVECPTMVVVPAGRFTMGAAGGEEGRPEGPLRAIAIRRPFAVGETEVTARQYAAFVAATNHDSGRGCSGWDNDSQQIAERPEADWRSPSPGVTTAPDEPVVCVSWLDAKAYVAWLSVRTGHLYRLPTEAEWEYFARAGSAADFPWGADADRACEFANVYDQSTVIAARRFPPANCRDTHPGVAPAGSYPANAFGLRDVIGNVWEWAEDCYVAPYPARPVDGSAVQARGACERRAVRGGGWRTQMFRQRPAWRGRDPENTKSDIFGFRVVRDLE